MSIWISNTALDKKIDNIRETLQRLTANYKQDDFPSFPSLDTAKNLNQIDSSCFNSPQFEATFKGDPSESACFILPDESQVSEFHELREKNRALSSRIAMLEEENKALTRRIDNDLLLQIKRFQEQSLKDSEAIQKLSSERDALQNKVKEMIRMLKVDDKKRHRTPRPRSTSREPNRRPNTVKQLLSCLALEKEDKIVPTVKKTLNFVEKLKKLIVDCSPTLSRPIGLKQMWKWTKRLVNEYLEHKEQLEKLSLIHI